jgi:hypothetical protein
MNLPAIINPAPQFSMGDVKGIAEAIAKGGLFGSKDPYAVLTLCLLAQAEGQHPAVVFRDYHIISGKPAKKADAMLRDYLAGGGKVEWHTLDDNLADATFSHPAGGSVRISWDAKRVQQAQLGGNAMHKKYPRQMLRARVISEGVRTVYPGATSGLYVPEEAAAFDDGPKASQEPVQALEHHPASDGPPDHEPATTRRSPPLQGPIKTRAEIRRACGALVSDLHGCGDQDMLDIVLLDNHALIEQVRDECEFFWKGDGADFLGLEKEIEAARQRIASPDLTGELLESHRVALEKLHECDTPKRLAVWMEDNQPIIDMADDAARKVMLASYAARCEAVEAMGKVRA